MTKKTGLPAVAAATVILIAVGELSGGGITLADGEELTAEKAKKIGLEPDDIADLVTKGKLMEVSVRQAETIGSDELGDAIARATAAEGEVKTLTAQVADLTAKLEAATKKA